jgi:hypothetical protein
VLLPSQTIGLLNQRVELTRPLLLPESVQHRCGPLEPIGSAACVCGRLPLRSSTTHIVIGLAKLIEGALNALVGRRL